MTDKKKPTAAQSPKEVSQLLNDKNDPAAPAKSAPGWFVFDGVAPTGGVTIQGDSWGSTFSEPQPGNKVDFYCTGEDYFVEVAKAIEGATQSVFVAGWQVNFDVQLTAGKTLFQCLDKAVIGGATVYVMPWMSPKAGMDTGDFETMLAVYQLNAGRGGAPKAFALPAVAQSDQGTLNIGFSHHQKLVVIDNKRAFVGGIDLAYGRRDDATFSLKPGWRTGSELYNGCVPPVHAMSNVDRVVYLTRGELLAACFEGTAAEVAQFAASAPIKPVAQVMDAKDAVSDAIKDGQARLTDFWNSADLTPQFIKQLQDGIMDQAQSVSQWAYERLDEKVQGKLEKLRQSGSASAADAAAIVLAWLNNLSLDRMPPHVMSSVGQVIETIVICVASELANATGKRSTRYADLDKKGKMLPKNAATISVDSQPRMPWHDVHCSIKGPSVFDLSTNFVRRWNGIAQRYENSVTTVTEPQIKALLTAVGLKFNKPRLPRIAAAHMPLRTAEKPGKAWVQVLRSAPKALQADEAKGTSGVPTATLAQNNCKKAMFNAIGSAQKFIYIEGQFFQSWSGRDPVLDQPLSGPMGVLLDITRSPGYARYAEMLNIKDVRPADIPARLRWAKVDDVMADEKRGGKEFMNDLKAVLTNLSNIQATKLLGGQQSAVGNYVGQALAARIRRGIFDQKEVDTPVFHVYMVLPVHPEGQLNMLNIMTQQHLTMQALVFGDESLVNEIRRSILVFDLFKTKKMPSAEATVQVEKLDVSALVDQVGERWTNYLTLLNLRNHDVIGGRPVTEQIYVHSKLLIADDRVAILGSANINDRSQQGDRDSELAVIIRDDEPVTVALDGIHAEPVSKSVHELRCNLWRKLFGLTGGVRPAAGLAATITKPAAPQSWKEIQKLASENAKAYSVAFAFVAKPNEPPSPAEQQKTDEAGKTPYKNPIWPTWKSGQLASSMPFQEVFWRSPKVRDQFFSYDAREAAPASAPAGVQGFIVALPTGWTFGENNYSGMNLTLLANNLPPKQRAPGSEASADSMLASAEVAEPRKGAV